MGDQYAHSIPVEESYASLRYYVAQHVLVGKNHIFLVSTSSS